MYRFFDAAEKKERYYCPICEARFTFPEEKEIIEHYPYGESYAEEILVYDVCPVCGESYFEEVQEDEEEYEEFSEPTYTYREFHAGKRYTIYPSNDNQYELCVIEAKINEQILDDTIIAVGTFLELKNIINKSIEATMYKRR